MVATELGARVVRLVVIDDHPLVREGVRQALFRDPQAVVVGEAGSVASGLKLIEQVRPDVVVLDLRLPDGSGIDLVRWLRRQGLEPGVLVLTAHDESRYARALKSLNVFAVISKSASPEELREAVHGAGHCSPASLDDLKHENGSFAANAYDPVACCAAQAGKESGLASGPAFHARALTAREETVLQGLTEGLTNRTIATRLGINTRTVEVHVSQVLRKLGAGTRTGAVATAIRYGSAARPGARYGQ
jgi:DNA-binding NarL/FixJ family response regulator